MEFKFLCTKCGQRIAADDQLIGQQGTCPNCHEILVIPSPPVPLAATTTEPLESAVASSTISRQSEGRANTAKNPMVALGGLFVLIAVVIVVWLVQEAANNPETRSSLPRPLQNQYKVTKPNGEIVTMTESELEEYNKEHVKERQHALQDLRDSLDKLKGSPSPSPY
jgi:hypothetical protein